MHAYTPTTKKDSLSHGGKALHNISPPSRACQRSVWVCEGGGSSAYGTQLPASICLDLGFRFSACGTQINTDHFGNACILLRKSLLQCMYPPPQIVGNASRSSLLQ